MFRYYSCLMWATAVVGAVLCIIASGTLLLALGLVMLRIGAGGLSAIWMSQHEKRLTPENIRQTEAGLIGLTRVWALELGAYGITAKRMATPGDVAQAAAGTGATRPERSMDARASAARCR